jgi:murein DD-endopeptidase MepM/ murein hydrolase activator NlpD
VSLLAVAAVLAVTVAGCGGAEASSSAAAYRLPWPAGSAEPVLQGVLTTDPVSGSCTSGCATHRDDGMHFALDFGLPEGTPVLAARGGTVGLAQGSWSPSHCGGLTPIADPPPGYLVNGLMGNQANFVRIDHGDGTSALYMHLRDVTPAILQKAQSGGTVAQGEMLGSSGKTGLTQCRPHLHFQVEDTVPADWFTASQPVSFADAAVTRDAPDGVPVEGRSYVSDNVPSGAPR